MATRNPFKVLWESFVKSFKMNPQRILGEFKGEDYYGNKYYELQPDPRSGRSKASRWFESKTEDLNQELPPEWMAWLRRRRDDPPTKEEIIRNLAIAKKKKANADRADEVNFSKKETLSERHSNMKSKPTTIGSYPTYGEEYESFPGENKSKYQ